MIRALQTRRNTIAAGLLVAGILASCVIYARATLEAADADERPNDSKQYLRQMEVFGGTANVLASEFREWFAGLWTGRRLAFTVAFLSILVAAGVRLGLTPVPAPPGTSGPVHGAGNARTPP